MTWTCAKCDTENYMNAMQCRKCGAVRDLQYKYGLD